MTSSSSIQHSDDFRNQPFSLEKSLKPSPDTAITVRKEIDSSLDNQSDVMSNHNELKGVNDGTKAREVTNRCRRTKNRRLDGRFRRLVRKKLGGKESALLVFYSLGLLLAGCGNSIFFKKMTNAMPNYGWFLSQLTCLAYVPIFGSAVWASIRRGDITPEMREYPKHRFAFIGLLDGLVCLMCIIGGAFTSGPNQMVLGQAVIPVTLGLSTFVLGQQFHFLQYIGALIIVTGVVASKWPLLFPALNMEHDIKDVPLFNLLYFASCLPSALSQIYKEVAFNDGNLDVNYMQYWVGVFQVIVGMILAPLNALPFLGPESIPLKKIPSLITGGSSCLFLGRNMIVDNCGEWGQPVCDDCRFSWYPVLVYLLFNIGFNVFTLLIIKTGGAALSFIVATLRLPLTTACFYSTTIMGIDDATQPRTADFVGLTILICGLITYRFGAAVRPNPERKKASSAGDPAAADDAFPLAIDYGSSSSLTALDLTAADRKAFLLGEDYEEGFDDTDDDDDEASSGEEVPITTLMNEPGPFLLRIHHHRTRPLYLRPIKSDDDSCDDLERRQHYKPPIYEASNDGTTRPPRRRTMHDFRDLQIRKISNRRLPGMSPPSSPQYCDSFDEKLINPMTQKIQSKSSNNNNNWEVSNESRNSSDLSDGSVNSLTRASRPHPIDTCSDNETTSKKDDNNNSKTSETMNPIMHERPHYHSPHHSKSEDNNNNNNNNSSPLLEELLLQVESKQTKRKRKKKNKKFSKDSQIIQFEETKIPSPRLLTSSTRRHLGPVDLNSRLPISVMLDGGLDLSVSSKAVSPSRNLLPRGQHEIALRDKRKQKRS